MLECVNLEEQYGDRFWLRYDPAAAVTPTEKKDPWLRTILCEDEGVVIFPHGGEFLATEIEGHPKMAKKVANV
jgi:hypothetical protein